MAEPRQPQQVGRVAAALASITSDKPVVTILTILAAGVAIIAGGVVTIIKPESLSFHQYISDIAFMAGALGLGSGIGRGIDSYGQAVAKTQPQGGSMETTETPAPTPTPEPTPEPPTEPTPEEPGDAAPSPYESDGPEDEAG